MRFIEFKELTYMNGGYISAGLCVAVDDVSRVVECADDYSRTNLITSDGKIHTLNEKYQDVVKKLRNACLDEVGE